MEAAVLIVEDQALIAMYLQDLVEQAGHRVTAIAFDTAGAIAAAATQRPHFALMDIRLAAGASGLEAARTLYESWGVRSIFLSANLDAETRAQAACTEPLGFIGKPFLPGELLAAIRRAADETSPNRSSRT